MLFRSESVAEYLPITTRSRDEDRFHISIAWTLQKPETFDNLESSYSEYIASLGLELNTVQLKIGNQVTAILLDKS